MAKKKADVHRRSTNVTPNAVVVRGTEEWRKWLAELADVCKLSQSDTIAQALMVLAAQKGHRAMPDRHARRGPK